MFFRGEYLRKSAFSEKIVFLLVFHFVRKPQKNNFFRKSSVESFESEAFLIRSDISLSTYLYRLDKRFESFLNTLEGEGFAARFLGKRGIEKFNIAECLEGIVSRATDPLAYFVKVFFFVDTRDNSCSKFILRAALPNESDASLEIFNRYVSVPGSERVFVGCVLDIHRPEIDECGSDDVLDNVRKGAVRVEFHEESHRFYFLNTIDKIRMECRLATRDANAIELANTSFQKFQKLVRLVASRLLEVCRAWFNEFGIVTKGTPENASRRKCNRREFPGIVQEGKWLISGEVHMAMGLQL